MLMTTYRLISLRCLNLTLGRVPMLNRMLRKFMVWWLVTCKENHSRYAASSRFFDIRELE